MTSARTVERGPKVMRAAVRIRLAVVTPPLVLAAIGLTHPHDLTPETAGWWTVMHIVLLPIFPLLGMAHWLLVRSVDGFLAWAVRVLAFAYVVFYGALDAIAGVATGTLVRNRASIEQSAMLSQQLASLSGVGNALGAIGVDAFLLASVLTSAIAYRRVGRRALPGALVLVVASTSFLHSHIYWPNGVLTMLGLAVGFGLLTASEHGRARFLK
jgi:hypothetical protein